MRGRRRAKGVKEPIQVYLTEAERALLDRVAETSGLSRAEVLRRGLQRMGGEVLAESHPVIEFIEEMAEGWAKDTPDDAAREHDRHLTEHRSTASEKKTATRPRRSGKRSKG